MIQSRGRNCPCHIHFKEINLCVRREMLYFSSCRRVFPEIYLLISTNLKEIYPANPLSSSASETRTSVKKFHNLSSIISVSGGIYPSKISQPRIRRLTRFQTHSQLNLNHLLMQTGPLTLLTLALRFLRDVLMLSFTTLRLTQLSPHQ